jgi:hypothetical protein
MAETIERGEVSTVKAASKFSENEESADIMGG